MWSKVLESLEKYEARIKVVRIMLELGLRVDEVNGEPGIMCGGIEICDSKIARSLGVDRRVVKETAKFLFYDHELSEIFKDIRPLGASLVRVGKYLGFRVVEIQADPHMPGIIASTATILSKAGIVIRQVVADDPDLIPDPKLTYVVEGDIPGNVISDLLSVKYVKKVTAF